jgi:hypothetical protein
VLPFHRPRGRAVYGGLASPPAEIISLFGGGVTGALYDPTASRSVFSDGALANESVTNGQDVLSVLDFSGNGNHLSQSDASRKATLQTDGLLRYIASNPNNPGSLLSTTYPVLNTPVFTVVYSLSFTTGSAPSPLLSQYAVGQAGRFLFNCNQNSAGVLQNGSFNPFLATVTAGAGNGGYTNNTVVGNEVKCVLSFVAVSGAEASVFRKNGAEMDRFTVSPTPVYQTPLSVFSAAASCTIKLYALALINTTLSPSSLSAVERWAAMRAGIVV